MDEYTPTFVAIARGIFTLVLLLENIKAMSSSQGDTKDKNGWEYIAQWYSICGTHL